MSQNKTYNVVTIIVHYNEEEYCHGIIQDLLKLSEVNNKIIIVDNFSEKKSINKLQSLIKAFKIKIIKNDCNIGFGGGVNIGVSYAQKFNPNYIHVINTDTKVINFAYLKELIKVLDLNKDIGLVGPAVFKENGDIQNTIMPFPSLKTIVFFKNNYSRKSFVAEQQILKIVDVINGVCFLVKNKDFLDVKGFDEDYFMYVEEHDLAFRLRQINKKVAYVSVKSIIHFGAEKENNCIDWKYFYTRRNLILFLKKRKKFISSFIVAVLFSVALVKKRYINKSKIQDNAFNASLKGFFYTKKAILFLKFKTID